MHRLLAVCALVLGLGLTAATSSTTFAKDSSTQATSSQAQSNANHSDEENGGGNNGNGDEGNGNGEGNGNHGQCNNGNGDEGKGKGNGDCGNTRTTTYPQYTTTDNGSCSQPWATDTITPTYQVHKNSDGTFTVTKFYNGTFTTTGPVSPGKCDNTNTPHGSIVAPGIRGVLHGYLSGTVTGGTYNPNGCNATPSACSTTDGFIAATFPGGTYSCSVGYANCTFDFRYYSNDPTLQYRYWRDASTGNTTTPEIFQGDIANS